MRFRSLVVLAVSSVVGAASATGCSDDEKASPADGGVEAKATAPNRPAPLESDAETPRTCRQNCEDAHRSALAKDEAVDTCWETSCSGPCVEGVPGDADGGGGSDAGSCVSPVVTISVACDVCTRSACCAAWDACFQDAECTALNACYEACAE
jgi:hypothetical protein